MKRLHLIWLFVVVGISVNGQHITEFSNDTALFIQELVTFTGSSLETSQVEDFERFQHLFDSLSYETRLEVIETSNLMLSRNCRSRPHFIKYEQIMLEFFDMQKTDHGYEEWLKGFRNLLSGEEGVLRVIDQWLSLSLSLLRDNVL